MLQQRPAYVSDEGGNTSLMRAALDGQTEIVKSLLHDGADVNAQNHEGRTALMYAIINFHTATAQTLLRFGANANAQCANGCTPLILAAFNADVEIAEALLQRGADPGKTLVSGKTALAVARQYGYKLCIELLERAMAQSLVGDVASMPSETKSVHNLVTV